MHIYFIYKLRTELKELRAACETDIVASCETDIVASYKIHVYLLLVLV